MAAMGWSTIQWKLQIENSEHCSLCWKRDHNQSVNQSQALKNFSYGSNQANPSSKLRTVNEQQKIGCQKNPPDEYSILIETEIRQMSIELWTNCDISINIQNSTW
jgi:hypothetical protein